MALGDVAKFVPEHRRQFVAAADHADQAQMHAQITAGQRKRVHRAVAPEQNLPGKPRIELGRQIAARARCREQRLPDALHILGQDWVVDIVRIAVDLARNAVAQAPLGTAAHVTAVAQRRQLQGGRPASRSAGLGLQTQWPGQPQRGDQNNTQHCECGHRDPLRLEGFDQNEYRRLKRELSGKVAGAIMPI